MTMMLVSIENDIPLEIKNIRIYCVEDLNNRVIYDHE